MFLGALTMIESVNIPKLEQNTTLSEQCFKSFGDMSNLQRHKTTVHDGIKKFQCLQCSKSYGYANDLRKHEAIVHGGSKDFQMSS